MSVNSLMALLSAGAARNLSAASSKPSASPASGPIIPALQEKSFIPSFSGGSFASKSPVITTPTQAIGPSGYLYIDSEFANIDGRQMMTYQDRDQNIRLVEVDSTTGLPKGDQKGIIVGKAAPFLMDGSKISQTPAVNASEFLNTSTGPKIVWTGLDDKQVPQTMMYDIRTQQTQQLTQGKTASVAAYPNSDASKLIVAGWEPGDGLGQVSFYWVDVNHPEERHRLPSSSFGTNGFRWAPEDVAGEGQIVLNEKDRLGRSQIALYDTNTGKTRVITNDAGSKADIAFVKSPEYGNEELMFAVVTELGQQKVAFYKEGDDGMWDRVNTIDLPGNRITSPEPVVVNGKTYLVVNSQNPLNPQSGVFLLSLDGKTKMPILETSRILADPEVWSDGNTLHAYAYEFRTGFEGPAGKTFHSAVTV